MISMMLDISCNKEGSLFEIFCLSWERDMDIEEESGLDCLSFVDF